MARLLFKKKNDWQLANCFFEISSYAFRSSPHNIFYNIVDIRLLLVSYDEKGEHHAMCLCATNIKPIPIRTNLQVQEVFK